MLNTCSFVLANGYRCRCLVRRNSPFCRHHAPEAIESRTAPPTVKVEESAESIRNQISAHWRTYGAGIAQAAEEDLPDLIEDLLSALGERAICHRSAGRLFAAIEDRRRALCAQAAQQRVLALAESFATLAQPSSPRGLSQVPSFQSTPPPGPREKNATC